MATAKPRVLFVRERRLSAAIRGIEQRYDAAIERMGKWIDEREARLREIRLNRKAARFNREVEELAEVMRRAHAMKR